MRSLIFSILLLVAALPLRAAVDGVDTIYVVRTDTVYLPTSIMPQNAQEAVYKQRLERYKRSWQRLIPKGMKLQLYGNMGVASLGPMWIYGNRHWETSLLFGFIPKHNANHAEATMTLKQDFIPWAVHLKQGLDFKPLTVGYYMNTVFSNRFWTHQPGRYPHGYYWFSTRLRSNLSVGERLSIEIPEHRRRFESRVAVFYEFSLCDYYMIHRIHNSTLRLRDIVALSLGVQFEWM